MDPQVFAYGDQKVVISTNDQGSSMTIGDDDIPILHNTLTDTYVAPLHSPYYSAPSLEALAKHLIDNGLQHILRAERSQQ